MKKGTCRVCGGPSASQDVPCYKCMITLIEAHSSYTPVDIAQAAIRELHHIEGYPHKERDAKQDDNN